LQRNIQSVGTCDKPFRNDRSWRVFALPNQGFTDVG
jgi:hypothetical protein